MRFHSTILLSALSLAGAFHAPSTHRVKAPSIQHDNRRPVATTRLSASTESEVERLRAAAAKAREEYETLMKESGKEIAPSGEMVDASTITRAVAKKDLSAGEVRALSQTIDFATDAASQTRALDALVDSGDLSMWKSAVRRAGSSMSLLVPFPVTLGSLETRTGGKVTGESLGIGGEGDVKFEDFQWLTIGVVLGSTALAIACLALLPENIGATFTYFFALIPVGFIGVGSTAPGLIANVISAVRNGPEADDDRRERICRHEAGHFLCGYVCGLPVKSYDISTEVDVPCVEFHQLDPSGNELSEDAVAALSVVAMSGSVAEILEYGKATGGEQDLLELQNCFRRSKEFIGAAKQQDLTRWGALQSYTLLKSNMSKYEGLVQAFKENKSLADCVSIIEGTA